MTLTLLVVIYAHSVLFFVGRLIFYPSAPIYILKDDFYVIIWIAVIWRIVII